MDNPLLPLNCPRGLWMTPNTKITGKFVGDTQCEKMPIEICGAGCTVEEGPEECHTKEIDALLDVPEEVCDLNPQKTCRFTTKLVPRLKPKHECTTFPKVSYISI